MAIATMTTQELADQLGTSPRRLRKFLRSEGSPVERVGKGHRYALEARKVKSLQKSFQRWNESHTRQPVAA